MHHRYYHQHNEDEAEPTEDGGRALRIRDPFTVEVLLLGVSFVMVFRVHVAYTRYWEALSSIYIMMSKWMDVTMHAVSFHLQCRHYDRIKPPSFFDYPHLNRFGLTRDRIQTRHAARTASLGDITGGTNASNLNNNCCTNNGQSEPQPHPHPSPPPQQTRAMHAPFHAAPILDGNWGMLFNDGKSTYSQPDDPHRTTAQGFASHQGGRTAPLFLQEIAHVSSLLVAVALSTLRNDIEYAPSPLGIHHPGSEWPPVDPFVISKQNEPRKNDSSSYYASRSSLLWHFLGWGQSPTKRTAYNIQHPLPVLGGVSQAEIKFLQISKGPLAKTQLCWNWLGELIMREHLAGTLGAIDAPIISSLTQFLEDGMTAYGQALRIMATPFPFPHAQLSSFCLLVTIPAVAILIDQYTTDPWLGSVMCFVSVTCLAALHEVARELENPFRTVPNELPLVTLQAEYNEALITMYAGYHPDFFWAEEAGRYRNDGENVTDDHDDIGNNMNSEEQTQTETTTNPSAC